MSVLTPAPHCFDYCSFIKSLEIQKYESTNFILFHSCFGYSGSLAFPYDFQDYLFNFCKKSSWDFDGDRVLPIDQLGEYFSKFISCMSLMLLSLYQPPFLV